MKKEVRSLSGKVSKALLCMMLFFLVGCSSAATAETLESLQDIEGTQQILTKRVETAGMGGTTASGEASDMEVHFIDVGQGDATLLLCAGEAMLIDAGDDSKGTLVQNYLAKRGVEELKYLILTHTDADHIGGADVIISKFSTENVFIGDFPKENKGYRQLMDALADGGYPWSTPQPGSRYTLGTSTFTILAPNKAYDDPNNCSIALLVENGEDRFLFTGDAEEEAEEDILANGISIDCDVFKAGHHGSKTSNSTSFLQAASPEAVVISCGEDNSYGHPHAGPLNAFRSMGVQVYRTDEQGSLIAYSNGSGIRWNSAPSSTWQAGEPKGQQVQTASLSRSLKDQALKDQASEKEQEKKKENSDARVWITQTGEKYHSINNCGRMNPATATEMERKRAEDLGFEACGKCY